jgi:hypothetical protein
VSVADGLYIAVVHFHHKHLFHDLLLLGCNVMNKSFNWQAQSASAPSIRR